MSTDGSAQFALPLAASHENCCGHIPGQFRMIQVVTTEPSTRRDSQQLAQSKKNISLSASMGRKFKYSLQSPSFYRAVAGSAIFLLLWYLLVDVYGVWRFSELPGLVPTLVEWFSLNPTFGVSIFTSLYWEHVWASVQRVIIAFSIAVVAGMALGIAMGWRRIFEAFSFPLLELMRPLPILAWIPLILFLVPGQEPPVIVLTTLAAFFVTVLNTYLGVRSIPNDYFRAAHSLGFSQWQILRHVIIPGALPHVFIGLQIAMAACWFSLVAAEIVSGTSGLGYRVWEGYYYVQPPTIIIGMASLGILGSVSSALVRFVGQRLMQWRTSTLGS
jgi:NitT/TauT family transport system permease protein